MKTTYTRDDTKDLFARLRETGDPEIRATLAHLHLPLVEYLAKRFRDRGEPLDDLIQVGSVGLLKAIDRFDLGLGEPDFPTPAHIIDAAHAAATSGDTLYTASAGTLALRQAIATGHSRLVGIEDEDQIFDGDRDMTDFQKTHSITSGKI